MAEHTSSVSEVTELFWGDRVGRVRGWLQSHVADVPFDEMQARMTTGDDRGDAVQAAHAR